MPGEKIFIYVVFLLITINSNNNKVIPAKTPMMVNINRGAEVIAAIGLRNSAVLFISARNLRCNKTLVINNRVPNIILTIAGHVLNDMTDSAFYFHYSVFYMPIIFLSIFFLTIYSKLIQIIITVFFLDLI